jgi:hypothetical protein
MPFRGERDKARDWTVEQAFIVTGDWSEVCALNNGRFVMGADSPSSRELKALQLAVGVYVFVFATKLVAHF